VARNTGHASHHLICLSSFSINLILREETVMRMRWFMSISASVALSILLSGCLTSNAPLITAADSARPLPAHFSLHRDGITENSPPAELTGDNAYVFTDRDGSKETLRFKKIADNLYAVSRPLIVQSTGELVGYHYGYMQVSAGGSRVFINWPDCKAFESSEIEKMGVEIEKDHADNVSECHVPSIAILETLITNYISDPKNAETIKSRENDAFIVVDK
jgi:hypothetical protein